MFGDRVSYNRCVSEDNYLLQVGMVVYWAGWPQGSQICGVNKACVLAVGSRECYLDIGNDNKRYQANRTLFWEKYSAIEECTRFNKPERDRVKREARNLKVRKARKAKRDATRRAMLADATPGEAEILTARWSKQDETARNRNMSKEDLILEEAARFRRGEHRSNK